MSVCCGLSLFRLEFGERSFRELKYMVLQLRSMLSCENLREKQNSQASATFNFKALR